MAGYMKGKRGLIMGLANDRSLAWGIAQKLKAEGAELAFSYQGEALEKRVRPLAEQLGSDFLIDCDVSDMTALDATFETLAARWPTIDFVVHAIGFSDKNELRGGYVDTSLDNFLMTMNISVYSFVAVAHRARAMMPEGGALLTLSYYGAEKVMPHYNVMGVAKAALETSVKYLANDLGPSDAEFTTDQLITARAQFFAPDSRLFRFRGRRGQGFAFSLLEVDDLLPGPRQFVGEDHQKITLSCRGQTGLDPFNFAGAKRDLVVLHTGLHQFGPQYLRHFHFFSPTTVVVGFQEVMVEVPRKFPGGSHNILVPPVAGHRGHHQTAALHIQPVGQIGHRRDGGRVVAVVQNDLERMFVEHVRPPGRLEEGCIKRAQPVADIVEINPEGIGHSGGEHRVLHVVECLALLRCRVQVRP